MVRWPLDPGLSVRMVVTVFLLAVVYFAFIAVLAYIGVGTLILLAVVGIVLVIQYFFSDKMVLATTGARVVTEQEEPRLYETLTRLCAIAGISRPQLAIVESPVPNAFATGRSPRHSVIAVTTALKNELDQDELEAVIAHELSHVRNRDVMVITLASFLSTAAFFIFRNWLVFGGDMMDEGKGGKSAVLLLLIPVLSGLVWVFSFLLIRALSRYREFAADRGSAILTGNPSHLASALMKISGQMAQVPTADLRSVEGMNAFFILPAISGETFLNLFSTHPTLEQRILALERISREVK
jgi:heat shock protein HtpX